MFQVTCTIIETGKVVKTTFNNEGGLLDHMTMVVAPNVLAGIITHDSTVWKD